MLRGRKSAKKSAKLTKTAESTTLSAEHEVRSVAMPADTLETFDLEAAFTETDIYNAAAIKTEAELIAALAAREPNITLADNIIAKNNIMINHDVEINFNGFSIVAEETFASARVLDIRSGIVTLTGKGKVFAMGEHSVAVRVFGAISSGVPEYTQLTIGDEISLYAPDAYGILISPNLGAAYGVMINFAGKIFACDGICLSGGVRGRGPNLPAINIKSGASIVAEELSGTAIEAAGYGTWKVESAMLSGAVGAVLRTGTLDFIKTQMLAYSGETFRIEEGTEKELLIKAEEGIYLSKAAAVIGGTSQPLKKFTLKECELYSPLDDAIAPELESLLTLKNCDFETDVEGFLETLAFQDKPEEAKAEEVVEQPAEIKTETIEKSEADELAEISDDDFVDEMFDFSDELSEEDLKSEPKHVEETLEPELKPAPTLEILSTSKSEKKPQKPRALPKVTPVHPFASKLHLIPELTDAETDEQEILQALNAEITDTEPALKTPVPTNMSNIEAEMRPPVPANVGELEAARMALSDAITEIRKLNAEDYEVGYAELELALKQAEKILAKPLADLAMIRDAAAGLLKAFDSLEEYDELSLSDAELDELFYQGAVLQEMMKTQKKNTASMPELNANSDSALVQTEIARTASGAKVAQSAKTPNLPEPDFTVLSDALTTISTLNLTNYTEASQTALLAELEHAQKVLMNLQSTQAEIDAVAANLLGQMSRLKIQPQHHAASIPDQKLSTPAPIVNVILPATMVDELSPVSTWSIGVTMIDELEPFMTDATTREKMLRAMYPWLKAGLQILAKPFRKLRKSIAAGFRAGMRAYRETLRTTR